MASENTSNPPSGNDASFFPGSITGEVCEEPQQMTAAESIGRDNYIPAAEDDAMQRLEKLLYLNAKHDEFTAILTLNHKIRDNPHLMSTVARLTNQPAAKQLEIAADEDRLARETYQASADIIRSDDYRKIMAFCFESGIESPPAKALRLYPGKTLLACVLGLQEAGERVEELFGQRSALAAGIVGEEGNGVVGAGVDGSEE